MAALVQDERIYETSTTTGSGEYTLAGAVTGFQPASVIGANNYLIGFVTDDTNWEAGIYTYVSGPDRLQRTHVVASSNGDAAVNWGAGTKKLRCGPIAYFASGRQQSKSVAGATDVTLSALEQRCDQLVLTGVLTGNINVIVDTTIWPWTVYNNTSGAFTLTVKTSAGTGVVVTQGKRTRLACDGTNVVSATDDLVSPSVAGSLALTGVISPTQISANTDNYAPTGLSTAAVLRISSDAARDLTGITGGASGRVLLLHNIGSFPITLKDSATSTAANQFALNSDVTLGADQSALIQYDGTSSRWRLVGAVTEINGLTALTAVDRAADYVMVYDASAGVNKKVTLADLVTTLGTPVATTSGASIDITSLPAGINEITMGFRGVSSNGTSIPLIQIGDSGGAENSGYDGGAHSFDSSGPTIYSGANSGGFALNAVHSATVTLTGVVTLRRYSGNYWQMSGVLARGDMNSLSISGGTKQLTGTLDRVRLIATNGTDTFDAGEINISYR